MPPRARIDGPGALHHVICRGIDCRKIYWQGSDRDDFLKRYVLSRVAQLTRLETDQVLKHGKQLARVYARSLMPLGLTRHTFATLMLDGGELSG